MRGRMMGAVRLAAALTVVLALAGCRQPDGEVPAPHGDQVNRIEDLSRDLQNLARQDADAPAELLDDLINLEPVPRPEDQLKALADALAAALAGATLPDADAREISTLVFQLVAAREMSESQIEQVSSDLRDLLVKAGAMPEPAERAAAAAADLAGEVTKNRKRWYHR